MMRGGAAVVLDRSATAGRLDEIDRREQHIESALQRWGDWMRTGRDGAGYPGVNVLHPNWSPPSQGQRPPMKVAPSASTEVRGLHGAIGALSTRLRNTLVVVYVQRLSAAEQAKRLGCAESTVRARVRQAKAALACVC